MPHNTCTVPGCAKPARSKSGKLCKMHYHRWYRHGDVNKVASQVKRDNASKYIIREDPRHPMAGKCGKVYVHRAALYDEIGPGWHSCHWCGAEVTWDALPPLDGALVVDHLNDIRDDNRLENLVVSCAGCNTSRAMQRRSDRLRADGWWSKNDTIANLATGGRRSRVEHGISPSG